MSFGAGHTLDASVLVLTKFAGITRRALDRSRWVRVRIDIRDRRLVAASAVFCKVVQKAVKDDGNNWLDRVP
jgi:hypothetical protein